MPHTLLEYSANLTGRADLQPFWAALHQHLAEQAPCRLEDIKSRASEVTLFRVGDGDPGNAFVHLTIRLMAGRSPEVLARVGQGALALLEAAFRPACSGRRTDVTVELHGMDRAGYFKAVLGPEGAEP